MHRDIPCHNISYHDVSYTTSNHDWRQNCRSFQKNLKVERKIIERGWVAFIKRCLGVRENEKSHAHLRRTSTYLSVSAMFQRGLE